VDEYMDYRHAFGITPARAGAPYRRFLVALRREAEQRAGADGSLTLGWTFTVITARRPRR